MCDACDASAYIDVFARANADNIHKRHKRHKPQKSAI